VHSRYLGCLVHSLYLLRLGASDDSLPDISGEGLIGISGYHEFVPYPISRDLFPGLHLFIDVLSALRQPVVGGLNSSDMAVRSVHHVATEVQLLAQVLLRLLLMVGHSPHPSDRVGDFQDFFCCFFIVGDL